MWGGVVHPMLRRVKHIGFHPFGFKQEPIMFDILVSPTSSQRHSQTPDLIQRQTIFLVQSDVPQIFKGFLQHSKEPNATRTSDINIVLHNT